MRQGKRWGVGVRPPTGRLDTITTTILSSSSDAKTLKISAFFIWFHHPHPPTDPTHPPCQPSNILQHPRSPLGKNFHHISRKTFLLTPPRPSQKSHSIPTMYAGTMNEQSDKSAHTGEKWVQHTERRLRGDIRHTDTRQWGRVSFRFFSSPMGPHTAFKKRSHRQTRVYTWITALYELLSSFSGVTRETRKQKENREKTKTTEREQNEMQTRQ